MKKFLIVLVAIMAIFAIVGCNNGTTSSPSKPKDKDPPADTSVPDTVIEGSAISLVKIGTTTGQTVDGNKYTLNTTGGSDVTDAGFGYVFTAGDKEYKFVKFEAKITEIDTSSCAAFTVKSSSSMGDMAGFGANSVPQYSRNAELNIGDKVGDEAIAVEMKKDEVITDQFLTSLFTGTSSGIYFQFNPWNEYWEPGSPALEHQDAAIHAKLKGNQNFTIEVTKITFTNGGTGSPDIELTADHFNIGNSEQFLSNGAITAVTVTAKGGIDVGKIDVFYGTSHSTAVPQTEGTHKIFIDVAGAAGYKPATKLEIGVLTVSAVAAYGPNSNGSFTVDPKSFELWYGATVTDDTIAFTNGGAFFKYPTTGGFDIADYASLEIKYVLKAYSDAGSAPTAMTIKTFGADFSPLGGSSNGTDVRYHSWGTATNTEATLTLDDNWNQGSATFAAAYGATGVIGIAFAVNTGDTSGNYTIQIVSITFKP